jgi:tetratricopeptide (TPR) repeat protein
MAAMTSLATRALPCATGKALRPSIEQSSSCTDMTTSSPTSPDSHYDGLSTSAKRRLMAATQSLTLGDLKDTDQRLKGLLAIHPDHPEVLRILAALHTLRGDQHGAIPIMERAVAKRPDDAIYLSSLGSMYMEASLYDKAIDTLRRSTVLDPTYTAAWYNLGLALTRCMRTDEAIEALRQAVARTPNLAVNARAMLGDLLRAEGRYEEAIAEYRTILGVQKHAGMAWWGLAEIKTQRFADDDLDQLREAVRQPGASQSDLTAMGLALAKALDDRGMHAESLATLHQAKARVLANKRWDANAAQSHIDSILAAFAHAPTDADETFGREVIFITSMPRSGSTLTEQILSAHSEVGGGGELADLPSVLIEESQRRRMSFPQYVPHLTPSDWRDMGRRYLERTARWRTKHPRFTDKLPNNWLYIGAIRAMLPGARIIIVRRDPLETCFACYRQLLPQYEYTNSFRDLATAWRQFDTTTRQWHEMYPRHVYESSYEALVADPETKIRELLDFCDLPFEQACLEFHKTDRQVYTPSATQVREPMRRDTARAPRYGALLDELRVELGIPPFSPAA